MSLSEVAICNMALGHIGFAEEIESLNAASSTARKCRLHYAPIRDRLLSQLLWPFAKRQTALQLATEDPPTGWGYAYRQPADALHVFSVIPDGWRGPVLAGQFPWQGQLSADGSSRLILSDQPDAQAVFTRSIENTSLFSPLFSECLVWSLAAAISGPLKVDATIQKNAAEMARYWFNEAGSRALAEQGQDEQPDSEFVTCRY